MTCKYFQTPNSSLWEIKLTNMASDVSPFLATIVLLVGATFVGMAPVVKLIKVYEAHHELKRGSAGWIRTIAGWSMIAF